jgi:hypothetical protein
MESCVQRLGGGRSRSQGAQRLAPRWASPLSSVLVARLKDHTRHSKTVIQDTFKTVTGKRADMRYIKRYEKKIISSHELIKFLNSMEHVFKYSGERGSEFQRDRVVCS